ncbi:Autophagy-related protein 18 [Zancudomyces culisetae]|uniref:Autophagy-related protein 18 n=1 Tax=Zancudomyces culisetae TaxID=1213189 RepID=A0A1R1PRM6_ZANCU|nr:Autophagy-related protein 18 [Zancudomyces culisetae]|eukprot:OMH83601.1 Autophagy-related protein 18 [Zancudomyces culisetae]
MCAMSPSSEKCYIAYPVPSVQSYMGAPPSQSTEPVMSDVMIFDANTCEAITVVQAHKRSVHAIAMNSEGTMLATASDKGTVGDGMAKNQATVEEDEFSSEIISRRSEYRASKAGKLSVSPRGERSIDTDSLEGSNVSFQEGQPAKQKGKASWKNIMNSKLIGKAAAYMPGAITEILEPSRDFAFLKLPRSGVQSIAAVSG